MQEMDTFQKAAFGIDDGVWGRENPMRLPINSHGKVRTEQRQALSWVKLGRWEGRERVGIESEERRRTRSLGLNVGKEHFRCSSVLDVRNSVP